MLAIWGVPYGLASLYDFASGQEYIPENLPRISQIIPQWASWLWLGLGILVILILAFEGSYRYARRFGRRIKPCLEIGEIKEQQGAIDSVINTWVLEIKNIGIEAVEECHALLQQITTEFSSGKLNKFPTRDFHWAGQAEGVECKIPGQQSANLGLVYFGGDKENSITLCYRANRDYRLHYDLSMFNEPILLLLNIKSKDTLPLYAVIRIDLEEMVKNLLIQPKDKPICQILWHGTEKRDLSEFTVSGESGAEGNGDEL